MQAEASNMFMLLDRPSFYLHPHHETDHPQVAIGPSTWAPERRHMQYIWTWLLTSSQVQVNPQLEAEPASQIQSRSVNSETHKQE